MGVGVKGLYVFVLGVGDIGGVGLGRVFVSRFVYPSEWDISIRCDHDMRKCRMVYVERFSRRDAERLGLSFDRVVEATRRVFGLVADLYASNVFLRPEARWDMRVEGDVLVARLEVEAPLPVVATLLVGEFVWCSMFGEMSTADTILGAMLGLAELLRARREAAESVKAAPGVVGEVEVGEGRSRRGS